MSRSSRDLNEEKPGRICLPVIVKIRFIIDFRKEEGKEGEMSRSDRDLNEEKSGRISLPVIVKIRFIIDFRNSATSRFSRDCKG